MSAEDSNASANTTEEGVSMKKTFHGEGLELNKSFMEWWDEVRKLETPPTPYEFLTNFGINADDEYMGKMFYQKLDDSIPNRDYRVPPGQLDFYAYYMRDVPLTDDEMLRKVEDALNDGVRAGGVTEQDIKSLVELVPVRRNHLELCIKLNYSADLKDFFFTQYGDFIDYLVVNGDSDNPNSQLIDETSLLVIQKFLPGIREITFGRGLEWTKEAFARCVNMIFQKECPEVWTLFIPDTFSGVEDTFPHATSRLPAGNLDSVIENLTIRLSNENGWANEFVLNVVPTLNLESLSIDVEKRLKVASPFLVRALQIPSLKNLTIEVEDDKPTKHGLMDVFEVLKTNSKLTRFQFFGRGIKDRELQKKTILAILEEGNTTLERCFPISGQIKHLLKLNRNGRGIARDPNGRLEDLLALFCTIREKTANKLGSMTGILYGKEYKASEISVLYGLLREQPSIWSRKHSCVPIKTESKKRKRCD